MFEKSLRDEAVAGDEGVVRGVSETFGCQSDGTPKQIAPKRGGCGILLPPEMPKRKFWSRYGGKFREKGEVVYGW